MIARALEKSFYAVVVARNTQAVGILRLVTTTTATFPLALPRTFALAPFHTFSLTPSEGSTLHVRAFPSSARENFPVESLRRHGNGIESLSSCCSGGGGIPKHERADTWEKRKERTLPNSPSFGCTRAIVCNSARGSSRNSPLSGYPTLYCSRLHRESFFSIVVLLLDYKLPSW